MRNIVILNSLHFSYPLPILMRVSYNTLIVKQNTSDYYKYTNKDAVKEFLVTTLSQCDTNGHFIETPYSESKLLDKYLGEVVLNIYVTNPYPEPIGEYILDIQDDNFGKYSHLDMWYVKQQVDKYWNTIEYFINEMNK